MFDSISLLHHILFSLGVTFVGLILMGLVGLFSDLSKPTNNVPYYLSLAIAVLGIGGSIALSICLILSRS